MRWLPLLVLLVSCSGGGGPATVRGETDYLIVTPPAFADAVKRLAAHREKGGLTTEVAIVRGPNSGDRLRQLLRERAAKRTGGRPLYILLAGDCAGPWEERLTPSFAFPPSYNGRFLTRAMTEAIATDGCWDTDEPGLFFSVAVGRLPADTVGELDDMIDKIVRFETAPVCIADLDIGIVGSAPDFDPAIDGVIESVFARVMDECVPAVADVRLLYGVPTSPYCAHPPEFSRRVAELYNDSSLVFAYVGHGAEGGFHRVTWNGRRYPILDAESIRLFERPARPPLMFSLACLTGCIDRAEDGIGEALIKLPAGPSAFVGATRVTHPAGNSLYGIALLRSFGRRAAGTRLGDILLAARRELIEGMKDQLSQNILGLTAMSEQNLKEAPELLRRIRRDTALNYILLGDPAMVLPSTERVEIAAPWTHARGSPLTVEVAAAGADGVELVVEVRRRLSRTPSDLRREGETAEAFAETCRRANDRTIVRRRVTLSRGRALVELPIPPDEEPGDARVVVRGAHGNRVVAAARNVRIVD